MVAWAPVVTGVKIGVEHKPLVPGVIAKGNVKRPIGVKTRVQRRYRYIIFIFINVVVVIVIGYWCFSNRLRIIVARSGVLGRKLVLMHLCFRCTRGWLWLVGIVIGGTALLGRRYRLVVIRLLLLLLLLVMMLVWHCLVRPTLAAIVIVPALATVIIVPSTTTPVSLSLVLLWSGLRRLGLRGIGTVVGAACIHIAGRARTLLIGIIYYFLCLLRSSSAVGRGVISCSVICCAASGVAV